MLLDYDNERDFPSEVIGVKYVEYGKENNDVIFLLHGGGLSWWNYEEAAKALQENYHVILPILDGHAESDHSFTTIEDNAREIIEFIDTHFEGSVLLIGGLSLGGQILLEILSLRNDICKYAVIESALVIPSKLITAMIGPTLECCYGLVKQKWFAKLQFKSLKIRSELFDDYYRDTCTISKRNMITFLKANSEYFMKKSIRNCTAKIYVFVGERENYLMKKSARIMQERLPESVFQVLPKCHHGEFSINHGKEYANKIREIITRC